MARRVSWTNNSSGHSGTYVYRSTTTMDPQALPSPIATVPAGATEYIDDEALIDGAYHYRVQDHEGGSVSAVSDEASISASVQAGDEVGGGYFAGVMLDPVDDSKYALIVSPKSEGDPGSGMQWQNAVDFAAGLTISSYTDWALPTRDEMRIIYRAFKPSTDSNNTSYGATDRVDPPLGNYTSGDPAQTTVVDFQNGGLEALATDAYWTEPESSSDYAWFVNALNGFESNRLKGNEYLVRAIRRVPV